MKGLFSISPLIKSLATIISVGVCMGQVQAKPGPTWKNPNPKPLIFIGQTEPNYFLVQVGSRRVKVKSV